MNYTELIAELQARGFDYLDDTRAGRYINSAYAELCGLYPWPFLEESATGNAPLAITDLGVVETVLDLTTNTVIYPAEYRTLVQQFGDLSQTGTPIYWYLATPDGTPEIATYPASTGQIGVQYFEVPDDLTGTSVPVVPARFHDLIVDLAVVRAYRDADNHQAAEALQAQVDRRVLQMVNHLFGFQIQGPGFMQVTGESVDW